MLAMKRLMVATDFSPMAEVAVERAAGLARDAGARLDLIHVAIPTPAERMLPSADRTASSGGTALDTLASQAVAVWERYGLLGEIHQASGSVIRALVRHAEAHAVDLVVLGFCGASQARHFLLGSTAERLSTRTPCPILVVKNPPGGRYQSVLVPVDFSAVSIPAVNGAQRIAPDAAIAMLHVFEAPFEGMLRYAGVEECTMSHYRMAARQEALEKMSRLCALARLAVDRVRLLAVHGHPSPRILAAERDEACDLIAIGKHGESVFGNLFIGSVTRRVIARSQSDVLICI